MIWIGCALPSRASFSHLLNTRYPDSAKNRLITRYSVKKLNPVHPSGWKLSSQPMRHYVPRPTSCWLVCIFKKNYADCFYASWFFSSTRMHHATKKTKCDMQDDENHYQFFQGLLHSRDDKCFKNVVETLLYSKCPKDPLSTVSKFCYCWF